MNNNEKFTRLRRLFTEYEALKSEKNLRIYDIQNLSIPGGLKENYIKEYKAVVDPKLGKVEDDIMKILDDKAVACVLNREDAIRYRSEEKTNEDEYYVFTPTGSTSVFRIKAGALKYANECCHDYECDDPKNPCPFKDGNAYARFKICFKRGCLDIFEMFGRGEYKIEEE